jgi:hypothetical protein
MSMSEIEPAMAAQILDVKLAGIGASGEKQP